MRRRLAGRTFSLRAALLGLLLLQEGCGHTHSSLRRNDAENWRRLLVPSVLNVLVGWPSPQGSFRLALTSRQAQRVSAYDNALAILYLTREARRTEAGQLLAAWAHMQTPDGSLPFSFVMPGPDSTGWYVRSGAIAWIGYAASDYLDADRAGPYRDSVAALAHRCAAYLLAHQVAAAGDPRDGLVRGGFGTLEQELLAGTVRATIHPAEIAWASTEHNIDAFFFLKRWARVTGNTRYDEAAQRIADALLDRAWLPDVGQFASGVDQTGADPHWTLDCASWGALFLLATGDRAKAGTSLTVGTRRYVSRDPATGATGHIPYIHTPVLANQALARHYKDRVTENDWDRIQAVWPEGTAGVALAAFRVGDRSGAERILDGLEPLRDTHGWLPTMTREVPFEFDTEPSLGATLWVEIVRSEMARADTEQTFLVVKPPSP